MAEQLHISKKDIALLEKIRHGADVAGYAEAKRLREIHKAYPNWFEIVPAIRPSTAEQPLPFFGARLMKDGIELVEAGDSTVLQVNNSKHNGKQLKDVPADYLDWLYGQEWLPKKYPAIYGYVVRYEDIIQNELRDRP